MNTNTNTKKVKTNKLHNSDIMAHYRDEKFHLMLSDFQGAFSYWVTVQNNNGTYVVDKALEAYTNYLQLKYYKVKGDVKVFTYDSLEKLLDEDILMAIPEILALNEMTPDYIDLGALGRNVFFMIMREQITQPL